MLPSKLYKYKGRYIALFLDGREAIRENEIPLELRSECPFSFTDEVEWDVMACPDFSKYIVLETVNVSDEDIEEFQTFECK